MYYNSSLLNIKFKWIVVMYLIIFYENLNMYINNIDYMLIYNFNVFLRIIKIIFFICIFMD